MTVQLLGLILTLSAVTHPAWAKPIEIEGKRIDVLVDAGPGTGGPDAKRPLLVIAPAKKYAMNGGLFEQLARAGANAGYYVVRFNWSFFSRSTEPTPGLETEARELDSVVRHFQKLPFIDASRTVLIAKSFGSLIAMKSDLSRLSGLLLLTPNCDETRTFLKAYEAIASFDGRLQITISKDDPYCDVTQIYEALAKFPKPVLKQLTIHTLFGDHNFEPGNAPAMIGSTVNWLSD